MKLPIRNVIKLIAKSVERERENKAWQMYVSITPHMTDENHVTFEEFLKPQETIIDRPADEILVDVKETLNTFKGRWAS